MSLADDIDRTANLRMAAIRKGVLAHIDALVQRTLLQHGIDPAVAEQCGCAAADGVSDEFAGEHLYIPYDHGYRLAPRDREVLEARRNGATIRELRRRYKMTEDGIKKLLKRAEARDPHLNQQPLF